MVMIYTQMKNGVYPTLRFMKTIKSVTECKELDKIENVQFYTVKGKTVEVWTYPTNEKNKTIIKGVDFITD